MKTWKRIGAVLMAGVLAMGTTVTVFADETDDDYYYGYIYEESVGKVNIQFIPTGTLKAGEPKAGVVATVSGNRCYAGNADYLNVNSYWSAGDVPTVLLTLYANDGYVFDDESSSKFKVSGSGATFQWADIQEGGESVEVTVSLSKISGNSGGGSKPTPTPVVQAVKEGWQKDSVGWWYRYSNGTYPQSSWQSIGGKWYSFNDKGYMVIGWVKRDNHWYYFGADGALVTGWNNVDGVWYYFSPQDGIMYANATTPDGHYVDANGARIR